jgi:hypothetical protein
MAKAFEARPMVRIIFAMLDRNCRNRMIVRRQFHPQVVGIPDVK